MESPKISVIVPVYNTADYLKECLDCFLAQTYKNFEAILVDDGSTDNSGAICDEYAKNDKRFKVIHKENGGVSSARNAAIDVATGDYIGFVDSDDTFLPEMYEDFAKIIESDEPDLVLSDGMREKGYVNSTNPKIYSFNNDEARDEFFTVGKVRPSVCLTLIKREVVGNLRFPAEIHHWEDYAYLAIMVSISNKIVVTENRYYEYREREGSATQQPLNDKQMSCLLIYNYLESNGVMKSRQERDDVQSMFICGVFYPYVMVSPLKKYKYRIKNEILHHLGSIYRSRSIDTKRKIMMTCFLFSEKITLLLSRFYHNRVLRLKNR